MTGPERKNRRLIGLFLLGAVFFNYPILSLFNTGYMVFGVPLMYLFMFVVWFVLIILMIFVTQSKSARYLDDYSD